MTFLLVPALWAWGRSWCFVVSKATDEATRRVMLGVALSLTAIGLHGTIDCTLQLPVILALTGLLVAVGLGWPVLEPSVSI